MSAASLRAPHRWHRWAHAAVSRVDAATRAANGGVAVLDRPPHQAALGAGVLAASARPGGLQSLAGGLPSGFTPPWARPGKPGRTPSSQSLADRLRAGHDPNIAVSASTSQQVADSLLTVLSNTAGAGRLDPTLAALLHDTPYVVVRNGTAGVQGVDATYDATTGVVRIPEALMQKMIDSAALVRRVRAISDAGGTPTEAQKAQAAAARHDLRSSLALLAHEATHAYQDRTGFADRAMAYVASITDPAQRLHEYVRLIEYPAQRMQEQTQLALRDQPKVGEFLTMDDTGAPYDEASAVARMIGAYGSEWSAALDSMFLPGMKFPGMKFPGMKFPGMKFPGMEGN